MSAINLKPLETYPVSDTFVFYYDIDKFLYNYFKFKRYNDNSYDSRMDTQFYICSVDLETANINKMFSELISFLTSMIEYTERKIEIEQNWTDIDNYKEVMEEIDEEIFDICYDCFHMMSKDEVDESNEYDLLQVSDLDDIAELKHFIDAYNDKLKWLSYYRNAVRINNLEKTSEEEYKDYILQAFNSYLFIDINNDNILIGMSGNLYSII